MVYDEDYYKCKWESLLKQLRTSSLLCTSDTLLDDCGSFLIGTTTDLGLICLVFKSDLNRLVFDYLVIEGYQEAAESFAREIELDQDDIDSPSLSNNSDAFYKVDYESIHERMLIREAVEAGRVEEAVRRVNELDSEVSVLSLQPHICASRTGGKFSR